MSENKELKCSQRGSTSLQTFDLPRGQIGPPASATRFLEYVICIGPIQGSCFCLDEGDQGACGAGSQVHGRRRERSVAVVESSDVAGCEGGQVGARQRSLDEGVGRVFSGKGLEPAPKIQRQLTYDLQPQRAFGVRPAGVYEEACGQASCVRWVALSGGHRAGFYPKDGRAGCRHEPARRDIFSV